MTRLALVGFGLLAFCSSLSLDAAEPAVAEPPIRALLVTGGCCHDYDRQKLILPRGISARANVVWTVVQQGGNSTNAKIPLYDDPNWAEGFDVVVHNECFADVKDPEWVERILKPHREGLPALVIHCAMHCYRTGNDQWFEFCGVQSPGHGPHQGYPVENLAKDDPIMRGFGDVWQLKKGELYNTIKLFPHCQPLAAGIRPDKQPQVCIWKNQYHKARVFGTTIGHFNETMAEPVYLDFVTRGLLWACDKLDDEHFHAATPDQDAAVQSLVAANVAAPQENTPCCGAGNLAAGKPTQASSVQPGNLNDNAVDGDLRTRWCANGAQGAVHWQVDLGKPETIRSLRIHWEQPNTVYRYKVDASADGQTWKTIVDQAQNSQVARITPHEVDAPDARYLRVTFLGTNNRMWGSFWEFEAYGGPLPPLPKALEEPAKAAPAAPQNQINDVQAPVGFRTQIFGAPPEVNYPVCLTAAAAGEVFVGVDEQGSLGKEKGRGKVIRCIDVDGDGQADRITEFAKMDHPRGLIYDQGTLWVLHPPHLTVYHDDDLDGVADREERLIDGISTDENYKRGADHTTNGIRMGVDGWIYIAVGDFGFTAAKGKDGTTLSRRGGGIVRVRPDGSEMEIYAWGLRNILDVSIDPYLNMFTRDNTNDGGGWNVRLSHILQSAHYGYPSLYINFSDEIMPPLADLGGGSGCGSMYLHDLRWPAPFNNALYTCDWGRSQVYQHNLPAHAATFDPHEETFLKISRPTDIDVDGSGRMYVSSWKDGGFSFSGPNVGYVAQITPTDFVPKPFPNLQKATDADLVGYLAASAEAYRLSSQRELLRRGPSADRTKQLVALAQKEDAPLYGRVAAIFTLKQLNGAAANPALVELAKLAPIREFALRALTDRKSQLENVPTEPFLAALSDENPRVRAQAVISLGRLGRVEAAAALIPLAMRPSDAAAPPTKSPVYSQPDADRVIPHLAVQALGALAADQACLKALSGPHRAGALAALRNIHTPAAVDGLIAALNSTSDPAQRLELLAALARLYHREGEFTSGWWGTRPDTSGPYFARAKWDASDKIEQSLIQALGSTSDEAQKKALQQVLAKHFIKIDGAAIAAPAQAAPERSEPIALPQVDPKNPNQIANLPFEQVVERALKSPGDAARGKHLFTTQSCVACHTDGEGQTPKGPHLVDIGKRYPRPELVESIVKPSAKIAQGFDTYTFITDSGKIFTGFVVTESAETIVLRQTTGVAKELLSDEIEERLKQTTSMMPQGVVDNLTPEQLSDLLAYLESLKSGS